MKCELCHSNDAETVIHRPGENGRSEELYVCHACAGRERAFEQERGVQVTAVGTDGGDGEPPAPVDSAETSEAGNSAPWNPPSPLKPGLLPEGLLGQLNEMFGRLGEEPSEDDHCPGCGTTLNDFRVNGGLLGCPRCYKTFRKALGTIVGDVQLCEEYKGDPFPGRECEREIQGLHRKIREAIDSEDYLSAKHLSEAIRRLKERRSAEDVPPEKPSEDGEETGGDHGA